ncbi:MAG: hypothetical protein ACW9XA_09055 [Candidatus Nitrosopumilus sp. bin_6a]
MNLQDIFSNETLQATLENLNWIRHDEQGIAHEFTKIPKENPLLSMILTALPFNIGTLGDYSYKHEGNFIKRNSPLIVPKSRKNTKFTLVKGVRPV